MSYLSDCGFFTYTCNAQGIAALLPEVRAAFSLAAQAYFCATAQRPRVNSAWRSLRHCAELMAGFSQEQLEAMYCRNGYPDYIRSIVEARQKNGGKLETEQVYKILQQRQEGYISWHLLGAAIDLAKEGLQKPELLRKILEQHNFSVFDEEDLGIACLHAAYKGLKAQILRK
ncbi:MAG: hypothetical protein GX901_03560 [Lentisphaerae bacterium]|nr:hypothetical protein [Lentisphaerota bacterium]